VKRFIVKILGSFFYTGFFPFAPATFASFVWGLLWLFVPGAARLSSPLALVITLPIAIYLANEAEKFLGKDAHPIVIDEIVGMQVTLLAIQPSLLMGVIGFVLFRIFDVLKPFPANRSQKLRGGFGVVIDDVVAGAYARIILFLLAFFFHLH
jgi:phosphatidylglycerophosphatase A